MKDYNEKVKEKKQKATDKPSASSSMAGDATLNGPGPGPGMRWMEQFCIHVDWMWLHLWLDEKFVTHAKSHTKNGEPQRFSWERRRRRDLFWNI